MRLKGTQGERVRSLGSLKRNAASIARRRARSENANQAGVKRTNPAPLEIATP